MSSYRKQLTKKQYVQLDNFIFDIMNQPDNWVIMERSVFELNQRGSITTFRYMSRFSQFYNSVLPFMEIYIKRHELPVSDYDIRNDSNYYIMEAISIFKRDGRWRSLMDSIKQKYKSRISTAKKQYAQRKQTALKQEQKRIAKQQAKQEQLAKQPHITANIPWTIAVEKHLLPELHEYIDFTSMDEQTMLQIVKKKITYTKYLPQPLPESIQLYLVEKSKRAMTYIKEPTDTVRKLYKLKWKM